MFDYGKLIALVKKHPEIFDMTNALYKDTQGKMYVWQTIAKELHLKSGSTAKMKWRNLRDSYVKHLKTTVISATGVVPKKYKHWPWGKQMEFLKPYVLQRQRDTTSEYMERSDSDGDGESDTPLQTVAECKIENYTESSRDETEVSGGGGSGEVPACRKRKLCQHQPSTTRDNSFGDKIVEYIQAKRSMENSLDAVDLLFLSYAETTKTFSMRRQASVKMQIAQIMSEAEIAHCSEQERDELPYTAGASHSIFDSQSHAGQASVPNNKLHSINFPRNL